MNKNHAEYGEYEAIDYGSFGQVFFRGMEWDQFSINPGQSFQTSFEIWLDRHDVARLN